MPVAGQVSVDVCVAARWALPFATQVFLRALHMKAAAALI